MSLLAATSAALVLAFVLLLASCLHLGVFVNYVLFLAGDDPLAREALTEIGAGGHSFVGGNGGTAAVCLIISFGIWGRLLLASRLVGLQRSLTAHPPENMRRLHARVLPYSPHELPTAALREMRLGTKVHLRSAHTPGSAIKLSNEGGDGADDGGEGGEKGFMRRLSLAGRRASAADSPKTPKGSKKAGKGGGKGGSKGGGKGGSKGEGKGDGPSSKTKQSVKAKGDEFVSAFLQLSEDGTTLRWGWHEFLDLGSGQARTRAASTSMPPVPVSHPRAFDFHRCRDA